MFRQIRNMTFSWFSDAVRIQTQQIWQIRWVTDIQMQYFNEMINHFRTIISLIIHQINEQFHLFYFVLQFDNYWKLTITTSWFWKMVRMKKILVAMIFLCHICWRVGTANFVIFFCLAFNVVKLLVIMAKWA